MHPFKTMQLNYLLLLVYNYNATNKIYLMLKCNIHTIDTNLIAINYTCMQWWFSK